MVACSAFYLAAQQLDKKTHPSGQARQNAVKRTRYACIVSRYQQHNGFLFMMEVWLWMFIGWFGRCACGLQPKQMIRSCAERGRPMSKVIELVTWLARCDMINNINISVHDIHRYVHTYIHTYLTLPYLTLPYLTLHYTTLHYITLHIIYIY